MTEAVCDIGYQVVGISFGIAEETVDGPDHDLYQINVLPFIESADVVGFGYAAFVEDQVDGAGMVLDIEPVADILALSIDREGLAIADIVDKQRNKLLRELIRTIVVRAVRHDRRHAVGVVVGTDKMVRRGLRGAVRAMRIVLGRFIEEVVAVCLMAF